MTGLQPSIKGKIINALFYLKNIGKSEKTVKTYSYRLLYLGKHANLDNPEDVKGFIADKRCSNSYKNELVKAYDHYVKYNNLSWEKPHYRWERKIPRIPKTEAIKKIIARSSQRYATVFTLLVETGAMPFELHQARLRDIDLERETLNIQGFKGHASRVHKLKSNTIVMLKRYLGKYSSNQPFPKPDAMGKRWRKFRNIVAATLAEPEIRKIRLYDLRHYYGTMTYSRTKDILYVKQQMGHKKIETTLLYTQLINFGNEEYTCRTAKTVKEATDLIEAGFEYVTEMNGLKLFRKRK